MDSRFNSPAEIASLVSKSGVTKSMLSLPKMILLGLMAGAFIAFGGAASDVAMHGVADVGLARVVAGVIFPVGLMLVVFTGSELFTGNCLMIIPTGVMAAMNPEYVAKAQELYGITAQQCQNLANLSGCESLLFVTIGNIIGGMVFVGLPLYFAYIRKKKSA